MKFAEKKIEDRTLTVSRLDLYSIKYAYKIAEVMYGRPVEEYFAYIIPWHPDVYPGATVIKCAVEFAISVHGKYFRSVIEYSQDKSTNKPIRTIQIFHETEGSSVMTTMDLKYENGQFVLGESSQNASDALKKMVDSLLS